MGREKQNAQRMQQQFMAKKHEEDFKSRHKMSDENFNKFKEIASERIFKDSSIAVILPWSF